MMPPRIQETILPILEPYLERKDIEYWAQSGTRKPTLPATSDNKVNVRELVSELQKEPGGTAILDSHEQHFFNKVDLASLVNGHAGKQGLKPIGSRSLTSDDDEIMREKIGQIRKASKADNEAMIELAAENARLRAELASLRAGQRYTQETGSILRNGEIKK